VFYTYRLTQLSPSTRWYSNSVWVVFINIFPVHHVLGKGRRKSITVARAEEQSLYKSDRKSEKKKKVQEVGICRGKKKTILDYCSKESKEFCYISNSWQTVLKKYIYYC